jgi:hypothetical protein
MYKIMQSANRNHFFPFQFGCFLCFSCPIALARLSITMLNKSCKNRCSYLDSDLTGKGFSLLSLSMVLAWGLAINSLYPVDKVLF